MAQKTIKVTICDRCGHEERTTTPAKAYVVGSNTKKSGTTWELCDDCADQLNRFLTRANQATRFELTT